MKQFSIREMLLVVVIFALALGWWVDRRSGLARFQMHVTTNHAYVLDVVTGQVWEGPVHLESGNYQGNPGLRDIKLPE